MSSNVNSVVTQINVTRMKEKIYDFTWVVENLNLASPLKMGQFITSPGFQIDCKLYELKLYPGGLKIASNVVLDIANRVGLQNYRSELYLIKKNADFHYQFDCTDSGSYFYVDRREVTSDFLPNGHLTIKWKLHCSDNEELVQSLPTQSIENMAETRRLAILDDFEKLLKDSQFSDIKIVVGTQQFFAHKNILTARSRYFAAMFESNMKEVEEGEIHITDISANIMQEILRFIYTGKIDVEMTMVTDLLIVADMYGLDGLSAICEEAIISDINKENIGSILTVIDRLSNAEKLKDSAIEFLIKNAKELSGNEPFRKALKSLSPSFMAEVVPTMMSKL